MKKIFLLLLSAVLLFGAIFFNGYSFWEKDRQVISPVRYDPFVLVIDAGHGGEDGGAVTLSGEKESVINLAVAQRLDMIMGLYGVPTVMLRETDISLHDNDADTIREKKVSDLHNRTKRINAEEDAVLVSIHQNSFSDPRYSGAHVFYAKTEGSKQFAEQTQDNLRMIDSGNERTAAAIYESVYLMNHINCPAILVECGFLSNPEEARLLQTSDYQTKIATVLAASYLQFQHLIEG